MLDRDIRICVVSADPALREELVEALTHSGFFSAWGVSSAAGLADAARPGACHVLLVDADLPPGKGVLEALRGIKAAQPVGLVLLAERPAMGSGPFAESGVDAWLFKPVDYRELVATLIGIHWRVSAGMTQAAAPAWRLVEEHWTLHTPSGEQVPLTPSERDLLQLLFANAGRPVGRAELIAALGHDTNNYLDHRLDMLFTRLRRKVRETAGQPLPLRAVRGVGFLLTA